MTWIAGRWESFDTETTGVDSERDLILSAALLDIDLATGSCRDEYLLLNWEVDIPEGAAKVHGLTRELLSQDGLEPSWALGVICDILSEALTRGPIVGMNLPFDLTMLDRNCRRAGVTPLSARREIAPVIDAMVLDKYVDPYRKGKRNLTALAEHYQVSWKGDAHNAKADARTAAAVAWRIGRIFPTVGAMDPMALHQLQVGEKKNQDASFRKYLLDKGGDVTGVDGVWPIRPWGA